MSKSPKLPFEFEIPVDFFEKSDAEAGKQRRIGGIISTENPDQQGEIVLAKGLDFSHFLSHGWFNDNHSKRTTDILGYPELVQHFEKGEKLPNGLEAPGNGIWAEGYLLNTPPADEIWRLGKALSATGRRLGFSVEGSIQKRTGQLRKTVAKALVRNVAITNCFPGDTTVLGDATSVTRRLYVGPMVEVMLASGHKLTGTPNHPVFTQRGWIPLGELDEVNDVVGYHPDIQSDAVMADNVKNVPTSLEQIFNLSRLSSSDSRVCPLEQAKFHGDWGQSDVDVVTVSGQLKSGLESYFRQFFGQKVLSASDKQTSFLARLSSAYERFVGVFGTSPFLYGSLGQSLSLLGSAQGITTQLFGSFGTRYPIAFGNVEDSNSVDSITGRDAGRTLSQAIRFSNIALKRFFDFTGHVFNLDSIPGWYSAGGVIAHNCPVNTDSRLDILAKSLLAMEQTNDHEWDLSGEEVQKALAMGPASPGAPPTGGAVLATESLETDKKDSPEDREKKAKQAEQAAKQQSLSKAEAISWVVQRLGCSEAMAGRVVEVTKVLKRQGRL